MINKKIINVLISSISTNPEQPRKVFEDNELEDLKNSIKEYGVLQPIIIRKKGEGKYDLIAGERRLRAAQMAGMDKIPAIVKIFDDRDAAVVSLVENVQRENLTYIEEANAYRKLVENFGLSQGEISRRVGKNQSTISNKMRILNLPEDIQKDLIENRLTERHARALLRIEDDVMRKNIVSRIIANNLNVRQTEKIIEDALTKSEEDRQRKRRHYYFNYRIYVNSIRKVFDEIKQKEGNVMYSDTDNGESIEIRIVIPKDAGRIKETVTEGIV